MDKEPTREALPGPDEIASRNRDRHGERLGFYRCQNYQSARPATMAQRLDALEKAARTILETVQEMKRETPRV